MSASTRRQNYGVSASSLVSMAASHLIMTAKGELKKHALKSLKGEQFVGWEGDDELAWLLLDHLMSAKNAAQFAYDCETTDPGGCSLRASAFHDYISR